MKRQICKLTGIGLFWFGAAIIAAGQKTEISRKVYRTFAVTRDTRIEINNKYGMVHINAWNRDSVRFEVDVTVRAKDEYRAGKQIGEIDVSFIQSSHFVVAKTLFTNSSRNVMLDLSGALGQDNNIEIDYVVFLPVNAALKIENKFGDIYCDDLSGNIAIELSNGNLKAHDFKSAFNLDLSFGNAVINEIKNGILTTSFSEVTIESADKLTVNSKSSQFTINDAGEIRITSRRDKYQIGNAYLLDCDATFSTIHLSAIQNKCFMKCSYGRFFIRTIESTATDLVVSSRYSNVTVQIPASGLVFNCDIIHTDTKLSYPLITGNMKEETLDPRTRKMRSAGTLGTKGNVVRLSITANAGEVNILQK